MTLISTQIFFKSPCLRTPDLMSLLTINFKKEEDIPTEHEKLPAADLFSAH
jgi:hypothetical protein